MGLEEERRFRRILIPRYFSLEVNEIVVGMEIREFGRDGKGYGHLKMEDDGMVLRFCARSEG